MYTITLIAYSFMGMQTAVISVFKSDNAPSIFEVKPGLV